MPCHSIVTTWRNRECSIVSFLSLYTGHFMTSKVFHSKPFVAPLSLYYPSKPLVHPTPSYLHHLDRVLDNLLLCLAVLERVRTQTQWVSQSPSWVRTRTLPLWTRTRTQVLWTRTRTRTPHLWTRTQVLWTQTLVLWTRDSDSDSTHLDSDSQWVQVSPVRKVQGKFKLSYAIMNEIRGRN